MSKDPVCGMDVDPAHAAGTSNYKGETIYFCNPRCKERFDSDPDAFMSGAENMRAQAEALQAGVIHTCPMHPEVRQEGPGSCPRCGMALEPAEPAIPAAKTEWTCPMHPEIVQELPGNCPICGMALELRTAVPVEEENPELIDMTRRFWVSAVLTVPLVIIAMGPLIPGFTLEGIASREFLMWLELILATPVVLWAGWPFFVRGVQSVTNRSPNMFTLIGLGVSVAYIYSLFAVLLPGLFPPLLPERERRGCHIF